MRKIVITGAAGFIGKNLIEHLGRMDDVQLLPYDIDNINDLEIGLSQADFLFHLAGVNRPQNETEFQTGNVDLTATVLSILKKYNRRIPVVMSSSTQAEQENSYGRSKRQAESLVRAWAEENGGEALIYRLPNVFGKWCRPNYNSVVATFCFNIAHDLPVQVNDPAHELTLVYIDDIADEFKRALAGKANLENDGFCRIPRSFKSTVGRLAETIRSFGESRSSLLLPSFEEDFTRFLYATYLSYLPQETFGYTVEMKHDQRGWLAELIKSKQMGQIFVSRTKPGVTRGNHWHHTKVEKFIVIEGEAVIRFRQIHGSEIIEVPVSGNDLRIVDIPAGYTHSIVNTGHNDLITLFWADELFDPQNPDTYYLEV